MLRALHIRDFVIVAEADISFEKGFTVFSGETSVSQMARQLEDLVQWLIRDNDLPNGAFKLTGTGVVPDSSFTLAKDDTVHISIDGIGTLVNTIVQG